MIDESELTAAALLRDPALSKFAGHQESLSESSRAA
jgi:hypothetical protein